MPEITTLTGLQNQIMTAIPGMNKRRAQRVAYRAQRQADFSDLVEKFSTAADAYDRDCSDETGEMAVNNVLVQYLTKYGELTAPRIQVSAA